MAEKSFGAFVVQAAKAGAEKAQAGRDRNAPRQTDSMSNTQGGNKW
jgi:hypothetical protein